MSKAGRPKSEDPRNMVVAVRLTATEYRYLQALGLKSKGKSVGEIVRALALTGMPAVGVKGSRLGE